jgi:hypothetical protein
MKKKNHSGIFKDILNIYQVDEKLSSLIEVGIIDDEWNQLCDLYQKENMNNF